MKEIFKRVLILLILSFIFFIGIAVCINAGSIWKTFLTLPFAYKDRILSAAVGIFIYIIAEEIHIWLWRKKHSRKKRQKRAPEKEQQKLPEQENEKRKEKKEG